MKGKQLQEKTYCLKYAFQLLRQSLQEILIISSSYQPADNERFAEGEEKQKN